MNLGPEFLQPLEDFALFFFFFFFFAGASASILSLSNLLGQSLCVALIVPPCRIILTGILPHRHKTLYCRCSFRSRQRSTAVSVIRARESFNAVSRWNNESPASCVSLPPRQH